METNSTLSRTISVRAKTPLVISDRRRDCAKTEGAFRSGDGLVLGQLLRGLGLQTTPGRGRVYTSADKHTPNGSEKSCVVLFGKLAEQLSFRGDFMHAG